MEVPSVPEGEGNFSPLQEAGPEALLPDAPLAGDGGIQFSDPSYGGPALGVGPCHSAGCCSPARFWVRPEYLLWWTEGFSVPPLVTTSTPSDTDREIAGVLGEPTTDVLVGNERLAGGVRSGGRISFGYWFDPCRTQGIEASYLGLGREETRIRYDSDGTPILARPFYNVHPEFLGNDAELVAYPEVWEGNVEVVGRTNLEGVEVLWRHQLWQGCSYRIDFLAGWRYNRLDDELLIHDFKESVAVGGDVALGTTLEEIDRFRTINRFQGAEIGLVAEMCRCRWSAELGMKLALGSNRSTVAIDGLTTVTVPVPEDSPDVAVTHAGLLAQGTNIGVYDQDDLAVIPELSLMLGYNLTPRLRATFGYTFIYWSKVARPGEQIDHDLNLSQLSDEGLVGLPRPEFTWVGTHVWAQGLSFGLDYRF